MQTITQREREQERERERKREQQQQFVAFVVDCLGEHQSPVITTLRRIIAVLGRDTIKKLLKETLAIEQGGGMLTVDGSRRRTPGGVFFYLVRKQYGEILPAYVWPQGRKRQASGNGTVNAPHPPHPANPPQPQLKAFHWEERIEALEGITAEERGELSTVKITLLGRPSRIMDRGQCFVIALQSTKVPSLPKGLPTPASSRQDYVVYIAAKQWKKVAEAIADPGASLIVEGYPQLDSKTSSIAVFATKVATKQVQAAAKKGKEQKEHLH